MQLNSLQKYVYLKSTVYSFSRMVFLNLFGCLTYQNDPFYIDFFVSQPSFFALYTLTF